MDSLSPLKIFTIKIGTPCINIFLSIIEDDSNSANNNKVQKQPLRQENATTSLKSRINSLLMKTLQQNTKKEHQSVQTEDDSGHSKVICTLKEGKKIVDELMAAHATSKQDHFHDSKDFFSFDKMIFALDCKGITVGRYF